MIHRFVVGVASCVGFVLASALASASPTASAPASGPTRNAPRQQAEVDRFGRPVRDEAGQRQSHGPRSIARPVEMSAAAGGLDAGQPRRVGASATTGTLPVGLEWHDSTYGVGIGATGLELADLDGDGRLEVVAAAGRSGFAQNSFWYVLSTATGDYRHLWTSPAEPSSISALRTADLDGDGDAEVLVATGSVIRVYDGVLPVLQATIATASSAIVGLRIGDVDGDGALELVFCDAARTYVHDLASGAVERTLPYGGFDLAIADVDGDGGLEIVLGNDRATGYVFDGATGALEWENAAGFGRFVRTGDLDGDGRAEIVAGYRWYEISVYDADTQAVAWSRAVDLDLAALRIADTDGDGSLEVLYGDAQWGEVHVLAGADGTELGQIANPLHGVTDIAVADVDLDGRREILFGAGYSSSGKDQLFVYDPAHNGVGGFEHATVHLDPPFLALAHGDVDGDGRPELLYGSFESDSGYADGIYSIVDGVTNEEVASGTGLDSWMGLWRLAVGELDGDLGGEVCLATGTTYTGKLLCEGHSGLAGGRMIVVAESGLRFEALQIGDVDGDGTPELVAATGREHTGASGVYVYVYDGATGALEWRSPSLATGFASFPYLRLADVDGDAAVEILVGADGGELRIFDGVTKDLQLATADLDLSALEVVDRNGDGTAEVVVGRATGALQVLDAGSGLPTATLGAFGGRIDGLAFVDLDRDGSEDAVFAVAGEVNVLAGVDGTLLWQSGTIAPDTGRRDSLIAGDLDGDGRDEIFVNTGLGVRLYEVQLNQPPAVTITSPASGSTSIEGDAVLLAATAVDPEDGDLSASVDWSSDLDGALGSGATLTVDSLSVGAHVLVAAVVDTGGESAAASVAIEVRANVPPLAAFTVSCAELRCAFADQSDDEDGAIASWAWSFGDGAASAEPSPTHVYAGVGTYTVSLVVTDDRGATATASRSVTVTDWVAVAAIEPAVRDAGKGQKYAQAVVRVVDSSGRAVVGVTVSGTFSGDVSGTATGVTGTGGSVVLETGPKKGRLVFNFCVTGVVGDGYVYAPAGNVESCDGISG